MSKDNSIGIRNAGAEARLEVIGLPAVAKLPTVLPPTKDRRDKRRWLKRAPLLLVLLFATIGAGYWWFHPRAGLPPGIASGNGRLEADEIDIDTKYTARIGKLLVDEGDLTKAGQILAKMDTQDLEASLKKSQALIVQTQQALEASKATLEQQKSQVLLAQQEIARTEALVGKGFATRETLDQRQQVLVSATEFR